MGTDVNPELVASGLSAPSPADTGRRVTEPLDSRIGSIQPGGGICMSGELAWGRLRRWYLSRFRRRYVARMRACRRGAGGSYPCEILDPRDLKYFRNQGDFAWDAADDPFRWRERLPFARVGLGELVMIGGFLLLLGAALAWWSWPLAVLPWTLLLGVVWFFRDPPRRVPDAPGVVVAPADGRVFSVQEVAHDEDLGGPAVQIDIFLSIFNVHLNRVPVACRVVALAYRPGKFLNALRPEASRENECLEARLEELEPPYRGFRVRQITGAIARRIVCWVRPGEHLPRGARFGMIKLGSRTELVLPREPGFELLVTEGQKVRAGTTVVARYGDRVDRAHAG